MIRVVVTFIFLIVVIGISSAVFTIAHEGPEGLANILGHAAGTATKAFEDARK